jgi:hypothetical protein
MELKARTELRLLGEAPGSGRCIILAWVLTPQIVSIGIVAQFSGCFKKQFLCASKRALILKAISLTQPSFVDPRN